MILRDALVVTPLAKEPVGWLDVRVASIAVAGQTIRSIGPYEEVKRLCPRPAEEIDCRDGRYCRFLAMPGFVDGHNHSRQTALRAHWADGWGLSPSRPQNRQEMADLFRWFLLDALKAGVTFVGDWPEHPRLWNPNPLDQVLLKMGLRGCIRALLPHDRGEPLPDPDRAAGHLRRTLDRLSDRLQLAVWIPEEDKPLFSRRVLRFFGKLQRRMSQYPLLFQMHLAESKKRRNACRKALDCLFRQGLAGSSGRARTVFIHAIWIGKRGVRLLGQRSDRVGVVTCPKFSDGRLAPIGELLRKGVPVGLGSDVASPDPFALIRSAVAIHRSRKHSKQLSVGEAFSMATLGGAAVFGLEDRIGSLEAGKQADIVLVKSPTAIDLDMFHQTAAGDDAGHARKVATIARLLMSNALRREHVDTVIVGGKVILRDGSLPSRRLEDQIERAGRAVALAIMKRTTGAVPIEPPPK
jgi:cytosine/adenosine deaminase-related metal-dependent hydrolase